MEDTLREAELARDEAQALTDAEAQEVRAAADADDPVFAAEQAHLNETYAQLVDIARTSADAMAKIALEAAEDKESMAEELATNYATWDDVLETQADFQAMNDIIAGYNLSHTVQAERLASVELLLKQPYFAKLVLRYKPGAEPKEFYIGNAGISDDDYRRLVVDWRSPVAEVYYNQDMGPTSYVADGRTINVDLLLRRQFDIEGNRLNAYFDSDVAIQDSLLLASLSRGRSATMQAITATIQKEQNTVIRHDDVDTLIVSGIAGSGKTSVLLQRIAFLFYRNRDTLTPDEVFLITPNDVFRSYIDGVLPDLGENNPEIITWEAFIAQFLPEGRGVGDKTVPLEDIERIDAALEGFEFSPRDFRPIAFEGVTLIPADQVWKVSQKFAYLPAGPRRAELMREELVGRLEARLKQMAATERVQNEVSALSIDEQLRLLGETYDPQNEAEARAGALTYLEERFAAAFRMVELDEWLDVDRVALRVLGDPGLTSAEWLYLKICVTGLSDPKAKYVMIDEVQDYGAAQLAVLSRYFRRAHFMLLGDANQAIADGTASFDDVARIFGKVGEVAACELLISYRSAPAITNLFASLLPPEQRRKVSSVLRDDIMPVIAACADGDEHRRNLADTVRDALAGDGTAALIVPWKSDVKPMMRMLDELLSAEEMEQIHALTDHGTLPGTGLSVLPLKLAKGLEFDAVIIPDASTAVFPGDDLSRRRLYTSISRATRKVTILAKGELTPLLGE